MVVLPWPSPHAMHDIRPGTERIRAFLSALGDPQRSMPPVIQVAGTNGKGSTVAFLRAIFEQQGYAVHTYTSPHLISWNERIVLSGKMVGDADLLAALDYCRRIEERRGMSVTHFEGVTAAAFWLFANQPADVCIIETGMGGRDDATNVCERVVASVITSISFDHQEFLGNTLTAIAQHKAGIMKEGIPCVIAPQPEGIREVMRCESRRVGAPLFEGAIDWTIAQSAAGFQLLDYRNGDEPEGEDLPCPSLPGGHQYWNAAMAVMTCRVIGNVIATGEEARREGVRTARWIGRLQRLSGASISDHFSDEWEVWCDGAHNGGAAEVLGQWLAEQKPLPLVVVVGCSRGRSVADFLDKLPLDDLVGLVLVEGMIEGTVLGLGDAPLSFHSGVRIEKVSGIEEAISASMRLSRQWSSGRLLVTGSLHLVGSWLRWSTQ